MGRYINCGSDAVWKYRTGSQPSEADQLFKIFGIGEYQRFQDGETDDVPVGPEDSGDFDRLTLTRADLPKLREILETPEAPEVSRHFKDMVQAIIDFIEGDDRRDEFVLKSEY